MSSSGMSPGAGVLVPNASSPQQEIAPFKLFSKTLLPVVPFHKEIMQLDFSVKCAWIGLTFILGLFFLLGIVAVGGWYLGMVEQPNVLVKPTKVLCHQSTKQKV